MRAGAFKQAATERNSSGGLIYQRAAPSVTQQKLPGVSPPPCASLRCFTWRIGLPRVSLKTMGTPMHSVSPLNYRFPQHMLEHICSRPLWCIGLQLVCWLQCSWYILYGVIVYWGLELEKRACHLTKPGHFFQTSDLISALTWLEGVPFDKNLPYYSPPKWSLGRHNPKKRHILLVKIICLGNRFIMIPLVMVVVILDIKKGWMGVCKCTSWSFVFVEVLGAYSNLEVVWWGLTVGTYVQL